MGDCFSVNKNDDKKKDKKKKRKHVDKEKNYEESIQKGTIKESIDDVKIAGKTPIQNEKDNNKKESTINQKNNDNLNEGCINFKKNGKNEEDSPTSINQNESQKCKYITIPFNMKNTSISNLDHFKNTCFPSVEGGTESSSIFVEAIIGEKEYPIYVEKGESICIIVEENNSSIKSDNVDVPNCIHKWKFLYGQPYTNYKGHSIEQYNSKNIGTINVRISGTDKIINIKDTKTTFTAENNGSILISANLNPNDYNVYEPEGSLLLTINGGQRMQEADIDRKTGYPIRRYEGNIKLNDKDFDVEVQILRYINKARNNLEKYINDFMKINHMDNEEEINKIIKKYGDTKIGDLMPDETLTTVAQEQCEYLSNNGTSGHSDKNNSNVKERIMKHKMKVENCAEVICYHYNNPLLIVDDIIFDEYTPFKAKRKSILSGTYTKIGINIREHISFKYCCVIVIAS